MNHDYKYADLPEVDRNALIPAVRSRIKTSDFLIRNDGTIFLVTPTNEDARTHLLDNVQGEAQFVGNSLVVEHRYISDLVTALSENGYTIR